MSQRGTQPQGSLNGASTNSTGVGAVTVPGLGGMGGTYRLKRRPAVKVRKQRA